MLKPDLFIQLLNDRDMSITGRDVKGQRSVFLFSSEVWNTKFVRHKCISIIKYLMLPIHTNFENNTSE